MAGRTYQAADESREDTAHEHAPKHPRCPQCHGPLTPYTGDNPHKAGSYECCACQTRYRLPLVEAD